MPRLIAVLGAWDLKHVHSSIGTLSKVFIWRETSLIA